MKCKYADNAFCSQLEETTRERLCEHCHIKRYAKGQYLSQRYWRDVPALQVQGMTIAGQMKEDEVNKFVTVGIASAGDLISTAGQVEESAGYDDSNDVLCMTECAIAAFDRQLFQELFDTDIDFVKAVFRNCIRICGVETAALMRDVGGKDAYAAVRYVVKYCRDHNIPLLTHEKIALACNRSRPTVTEMLHRLVENEPDLFTPQS